MTTEPTPTGPRYTELVPGTVPDAPCVDRAPCRIVTIGPPTNAPEGTVEPVEMLHSLTRIGHTFSAYARPTPEQLEVLNAGGYIEMTQWTTQVVPFALAVWPGDGA